MGFEIGSFPRMLRGDISERLLYDFTPHLEAVPGLKDGAVLAVLPAVALFVLLRQQLLEGLSTGAVKGWHAINPPEGEACSSCHDASCSVPRTTTSTSRTNASRTTST
ncbi:hypothetical protein [Streptomyces sp. NPDC050164]|uniref:hypothetical protein n=1 Tax=Streptomyces sp. NPDC050164 TaxID=3365605 RepID=UPI0037966C6D